MYYNANTPLKKFEHATFQGSASKSLNETNQQLGMVSMDGGQQNPIYHIQL